jgi:hypothetical protein
MSARWRLKKNFWTRPCSEIAELDPASQSPASLAPSSSVCRPSPSGAPLTPSWPAGAHMPWRLRSFPAESRGHPRAWPVLLVLVHCGSPLAPIDSRNRPGRPPYIAYVCFKCFRCLICILQLFHLNVAKVDRGMLHMLHIYCKCFRGMLQVL